MVEEFRKKPVIIKALQWTGKNYSEIQEFTNNKVCLKKFDYLAPTGEMDSDEKLLVYTLEGAIPAKEGDYIIRGVKGEFYPCDPLVFCEVYDKVE